MTNMKMLSEWSQYIPEHHHSLTTLTWLLSAAAGRNETQVLQFYHPLYPKAKRLQQVQHPAKGDTQHSNMVSPDVRDSAGEVHVINKKHPRTEGHEQ